MLAAVVPARNEEKRISQVLRHLRTVGANIILPVVNGCTDNTLAEIEALDWPEIKTLHFPQSLGIDIPRSVGAKAARDLGAGCVLFVDGDMVGELIAPLLSLEKAIRNEVDLALTDCYPSTDYHSHLTRLVLSFRRRLNLTCGLEELGVASPSHGPVAVSRHFLYQVPLQYLAIPPVALAQAHLSQLTIRVAASIPHERLQSAVKNDRHAHLVADTIIGDCLEALCHCIGIPPSRSFRGREYLGYHPQRRWDILAEFLQR
ncbi:MAG: glycosyltransferase [Firmicutes bacterium]|nr:glycosyltransferase [Bacillota bacterium]